MKDNLARIGVVLIAVVIAAVYFFGSHQAAAPVAGNIDGPTTFGILGTENIKIGSSCASGFKFNTTCQGTAITKLLVGTCSLIASSFSFAASTSIAVDCAVTNATPGDIVDAMFGTSTSNGAGWLITQASASTTPGFLTFRIVNNTGATAIIPASIASTTDYQIFN